VARDTDFAWRCRCDLSHRLGPARKTDPGATPDLRLGRDPQSGKEITLKKREFRRCNRRNQNATLEEQ
jgi:hypothetical protein